MSTDLRRSLFAAAFAGAALAGCGGGGNGTGTVSGSPSPSPAPAPTPAPPPASAGSYFLAGHANTGFGAGGAQIAFFDSPQAVNPYALWVVDPVAGASSAMPFEAEQTTLDIANASEWFPATGNMATAWGVRYRLFARHDGASGNDYLYKIDLRKSGAAGMPAGMQMSSAVVAGSGAQPALCWFDRAFFDNYRSADQSWIVFHAKGPDANCGSADDQFVGVRADYASTTAPMLLKQLQPVEAVYDGTGLITGFLAINHPAVNASNQPVSPVPLQQLNADFSVKTTYAQTLIGIGVTGNSGDFVSLGVSPLGVWLYRDSSDIWAVDVAAGTSSKLFTLGATTPSVAGDTVPAGSRAVFDSNAAYVAVVNAAGSYVLQFNLSTKMLTAALANDASAGAGIDLVGVTSSNLVYVVANGSSIKSVSKSNVGNAAVTLYSAAANQSVQGPLGSPSGTAPAVYLVGDQVYFTVGDSVTGARLAYTGSGNSGTATALGAGSDGAVLGTIAASTFSAAGPVVNAGALVLTGGVHSPSQTFSGAALSSYNSSGALGVAIGTLPVTTLPMPTVAIASAPLQAGMPGLIEMTGGSPTNTGLPVDDLGQFDPGAATSFARDTAFMQ